MADVHSLLNAKLTPREMVYSVLHKYGEEYEDAFDQLIGIFENATYSTKNISRRDYEVFYTLLCKIPIVK